MKYLFFFFLLGATGCAESLHDIPRASQKRYLEFFRSAEEKISRLEKDNQLENLLAASDREDRIAILLIPAYLNIQGDLDHLYIEHQGVEPMSRALKSAIRTRVKIFELLREKTLVSAHQNVLLVNLNLIANKEMNAFRRDLEILKTGE